MLLSFWTFEPEPWFTSVIFSFQYCDTWFFVHPFSQAETHWPLFFAPPYISVFLIYPSLNAVFWVFLSLFFLPWGWGGCSSVFNFLTGLFNILYFPSLRSLHIKPTSLSCPYVYFCFCLSSFLLNCNLCNNISCTNFKYTVYWILFMYIPL